MTALGEVHQHLNQRFFSWIGLVAEFAVDSPSEVERIKEQVLDFFQSNYLYTNNLKKREFDKEAPQIFCSERVTIAERQGASENEKYEAQLTRSKTDFSGCLCIDLVKGHTRVEAQNYIKSLVERQIFKLPPAFTCSDKSFVPFRDQIVKTLCEMAAFLPERELLREVETEALKQGAEIEFEEAFDSFGSFKGVFQEESCVTHGVYRQTEIEKMAGAKERKYLTIALNTRTKRLVLMQDERGEWYLEKMPLLRTLAHELIHVLYNLNAKNKEFDKLPKTARWSIAEEEAVITGQVPGAIVKFTENAFARARGWKERISHRSVECDHFDKELVFANALFYGAAGTVRKLAAEGMERAVVQAGAQNSHRELTDEEWNKICNHLDFRYVSADTIVEARLNLILELPESAKVVDTAFLEEIQQRKRDIYPFIIDALSKGGQGELVQAINARVEPVLKKSEESLVEQRRKSNLFREKSGAECKKS